MHSNGRGAYLEMEVEAGHLSRRYDADVSWAEGEGRMILLCL